MAGKNPTLLITGGLNKKATKDAIQAQLDKLGNELKLTIGVDKNANKDAKNVTEEKKKQLNVERLISEAKERTARAEQKQFDLARSKTSKLLKQEIQDRVTIEKQTLKQVNAEKAVASQIEKQKQNLALYQEEFSRRSSKLMAGKYSGRVDTTALTSLQNQVSGLSVDSSDSKAWIATSKQIDSQFKNIATNAQLASRGIKGFGEDLSKNLTKFSEWMVASTVFYGIARAIQSGVQSVFELDSALTDLKKVVNATNEEVNKFVKNSYAIANSLGATNIQVIQAVTVFSKMGYALDQSTQLGSLAVKLQTVGDGMGSMEDTANSLVAVLKGFGVDENSAVAEVTKRIDQLNAVSNEMAVSTGDLTSGLERASAGLAVSGNSFEQSTALLTAGTEVLRDSEMVARGLITTSQRIYDQGADALKQYGIETVNANGSIRSTFDILTDLHKILPTITEDEQRWILTQISGKDQFKTMASIMQNWNAVAKTMEIQTNANGSASEELNRKLESLEGRVNKMTNAFAKFWNGAINNNFIKTIISGITLLTDSLTVLNGLTQGMLVPTTLLIALLMKFKDIQIVQTFLAWTSGLIGFSTAEGVANVATIGLTISLKALTAAIPIVGAVMLVLGIAISKYQEYTAKATEETDKFTQAQSQLNLELAKGDQATKDKVNQIQSLIDKYDTLNKKQKETNVEYDDRGRVHYTEDYKKTAEEIRNVEAEFKKLGLTANEAKEKIKLGNDSLAETAKQSKITSESMEHLKGRIVESSDKYSLLKSAQEELNDQGHLSQATIDAISEKYGKFINVTKLSATAIVDFVNTEKKAITQSIQNNINETNAQIESRQKKIDSIKSEIKALGLLAQAKGEDSVAAMYNQYAKGRQLESVLKEIDELQDKNAELKNSLLEIASIEKGSDKTKSTSSKSSASKKDPYLSTLNLQYQELENQISLTNQALKDNQNEMTNKANTDKEKISYLEKEVELNKQLQKQYSDIAQAKKSEMQSIQSKLNAFGLGVSTDAEDNITIKNWKNINSLSEDNRKIADDLISKMQSLSGEVKGYGDSWTDANNKIISDNKEIASILKNDIIASLEKQKKLVTDDLLDGIKDEIDALEKARDIYKDKIDKQIKGLETTRDLLLDSKDLELEAAQTALDNYNDAISAQEEVNKLKEIDNKITEENINYQKELAKLLDEKNSILSNKNVRQLNAQGTGFEFVADPLALKENADKITDLTDEHTQSLADLIESRDQEVKDQAIKAEQQRLQAVIDRINKEKKQIQDNYNYQISVMKSQQDAEVESYNNRIEALKTFQSGLKEALDTGNAITRETQAQLFTDLTAADNSYFSNTISGYRAMVNEINSILASIGTTSGTPAQSPLTLTPPTRTSRTTVPTFHDGIENGLIGGIPLKDNEVIAKVAKGEGVFNAPQLSNLSSFINTAIPAISNTVKTAGDIIIQNMTITTNNPKDFAYKMRDLRIGNS